MGAALAKPDYARVMREVRRIHDMFGITEPAVDPLQIARDLGVFVYFADFHGDEQNISGYFDCVSGTIYVNRKENARRMMFTVAHELGHKVLHEEWAKSNDYSALMRDSFYSADEPHEKEANAFAANLLVPRFMLDKYRKMTDIEGLSKLFIVSAPVIRNRLKKGGLYI
jgi:Zn-dependent peptidase ImmA (M78 family)